MQQARYVVLSLAAIAGGRTAATAGPDDAAQVLARAQAALGFDRAAGQVIHARSVAAADQAYQSDRSYPPFFSAMLTEETWFDPATGVMRTSTQTMFPGNGPPPRQTASDGKRVFTVAEDGPRVLPLSSLQARYLDAWAVVADWAAAPGVRVAGREIVRDYPRIVLVRATPAGEQRLFVDPKTGFPVELSMVEPHYLWGQRRIDYVYANWMLAAGIMVAGSSVRLADGATDVSRTVGEVELVAASQPPALALPAEPAWSPVELPRFLQPLDLTTVAVGPNTYLLSNVGYTEAVTRVGDEVIVFEATQGDERVRKDLEAIGRLFPGSHKVTVVVTDLAWPHIAGVRAWVARGATIVTHAAARAFLTRVIDRRWTLAPDLLERQRARATVKIVGVTAWTPLAGGAVTLHPIDGIGSELALMGYVAADRFLWASDYVQSVTEPTSYAREVVAAVRRDGLAPERVAAEHTALTPWPQLEALERR